ncbi:hypothetical protein ANT2_3798 [plant metagenome]|uniref:Uncharacterized protein n=1 Tax=plant metagenome TaxID=1297885 RepID=A0A484QM60_9ZZZZ
MGAGRCLAVLAAALIDQSILMLFAQQNGIEHTESINCSTI